MEALSPTMEEGQLVRWLKSEGDPVSNGEILAEIETDKATMELVARGDGVLRKVFLAEGATTPVGEVIAIIAGEDEDISGMVPEGAGATAEPVAEEQSPAPEPPASSQAPVEAQEAPAPAPATGAGTEEAGETAAGPEGTAETEASPVSAGEPRQGESVPQDGRIKASPLARRMAEEANLDLSRVKGSGPGGRVVKRDVEAARESGAASLGAEPGAGAGGPEAAGAPSRPVAGLPELEYEDIPLTQMRKTIAKRLVESISPVPHFFLRITVDMTRILEARKRVNGILEEEGEKVSINDFILRATAQALARHPEVNAQWTGEAIRRHYRVHLGVAVAVEDGLITPAARGREKRLQPEEYTGATFSVSNLGMFGIHEFTGVINPPEAGILAVGGIEETPVAEEGEVVVRPLMKVTMSCDHRVVDGATGARFLQTLKAMLEEPASILI